MFGGAWGRLAVGVVCARAPSLISVGIHVQLRWHPGDGHLSVAVNDTKAGRTFELAVRDHDRALDVFHHPYAYAA